MNKHLSFHLKCAAAVVLAALLAVQAFFIVSKPVKAQVGPSVVSRGLGVYNAQAYTNWGASIITGNSATGSQTDIFCPWYVPLPDGRVIQPFSAPNSNFVPISVDRGASNEVVTPTAVSQVAAPTGTVAGPCASVTASFSNTHGSGVGGIQNVITGDGGIMEAANDASNNGGGSVYFEIDCGNITLSTGGATTTVASGPCVNIPKTFTTGGVSVNVVTTITTSASYSVGIASATTAFATSCTALTAGTTCSQFVAAPTKVSTGAGFGALLITANAAAGAGVVHVKVWGTIGAQSGS